MEKVKQTTLVLGEGITEFFFLDSLKDEYRALRQVYGIVFLVLFRVYDQEV